MTTRVKVGRSGYDVVIGRGLNAEVAALAGGVLAGAEQIVLIHQPTVLAFAAGVAEQLQSAGPRVTLIEIPDGEAAKTVEVAACWARLGELA